MAIWFAIALLAGIIFILGIFYLINSVHRYGKWLAPTILLIVSLIVCVGCGLNAYHLHQEDQKAKISSNPMRTTLSAEASSQGGMVENGLQVINNGIQEDKGQQQVLKDLQQSFAKVGTVTFDQQSKTFTVTPTTDQDVKAINYVLANPQKAQQSGYNNLTSGILSTSKQLTKPLGKGYTLQLTKPNSNQVIYAAKDGQVLTDVVNNKN